MGGENVEVRLIGVNTTEKGECFSDPPLDYLIENVKGRTVGLEAVGRDQFGRTLGNVWLDDELINLTLVQQGLAIAQSPDGQNPYGERVVETEEIAFDERLGLWAPDACGSGENTTLTIDSTASVFDTPGPDGEYLTDEIVVIVNQSSEAVDIGGYTLRDESSRNRFVFGEDALITPNGSIEVDAGCEGTFSWCQGRPIWNNGGDMVLILDPLGNVAARFRY